MRSLHVDAASPGQRLFVQRISRFKGTYTFTARSFVRGIEEVGSPGVEDRLFLDQHPFVPLQPLDDEAIAPH